MLEVKRLRLLREFAIRGTVGEVADVLSYSPSAVSQQLALLEKETGVKLLRKVGRGLELTPAAEALVARTERVLDLLEEAEASLRSAIPVVTGTIRIAAFQSAMISLFPHALRLLGERHPELRIEVVQHEPEVALRETWARGFDLVVAEQYPGHAAPHHEGLGRTTLGHDFIYLAVPGVSQTRFAGVERIEDAAHLPWVMEPKGAASRHWAEQACRQAGFEPDVRFETADIQSHLRLIESGNAVALINGLSAAGAVGPIRLLELPEEPMRTVFIAARDSSGGHPAIAAVMEALAEVAEGLPLS